MSENLAQTLGDNRVAQELVQRTVMLISDVWDSLREIEEYAQQVTGVAIEIDSDDLEDYVIAGGISRADARKLLIDLVEMYSDVGG